MLASYACTAAAVILVTLWCIHKSMAKSMAGQSKTVLQKESHKCQKEGTCLLHLANITQDEVGNSQLTFSVSNRTPSTSLQSCSLVSWLVACASARELHVNTGLLTPWGSWQPITPASRLSWILWVTALLLNILTVPMQAGIIQKSAESALSPIVHITNSEDIKIHWPQNLSLRGTATRNQLSDGLFTANHNLFSLVVQPVFHLLYHLLILPILHCFDW